MFLATHNLWGGGGAKQSTVHGPRDGCRREGWWLTAMRAEACNEPLAMNVGKGARTALFASFGHVRGRIARTGLSSLRRVWGMAIGLMVCWGFVLGGGQWA